MICSFEFCLGLNMLIGHPNFCGEQIARRRRAHQEKRPDAKIISLGIGDTTEPIPPRITQAMERAGKGLGSLEGYSGRVLLLLTLASMAQSHISCMAS